MSSPRKALYTYTINNSTDTASPASGALTVLGGAGVSRNLSVGGTNRLYDSTGLAYAGFKAPTAVTTYTLVLPPTLPTAPNYALVGDNSGTLSWSKMGSATPSSFSALQGQTAPLDVIGMNFAANNSFEVNVYVTVSATTSLTALFTLKGVKTATGWYFSSQYMGDDTGVLFTLTAGGQIQYTSGTYAGFSSLSIQWLPVSLF